MSAWFCLGPDQRITSGPAAKAAASRWRRASRRKQAEYMTAPERFAEKSDALLHRGRRPYMTHSGASPPSIDALRKAHLRRRAGLRLPGAITDDLYCSAADPVNPEPGMPTMRLLPYVRGRE